MNLKTGYPSRFGERGQLVTKWELQIVKLLKKSNMFKPRQPTFFPHPAFFKLSCKSVKTWRTGTLEHIQKGKVIEMVSQTDFIVGNGFGRFVLLRPAGFENSAPSSLELLPFIWMQMIAYALNFDFYRSALYVYNLLYCFMKKKGGGTEFDQCLEKCLKEITGQDEIHAEFLPVSTPSWHSHLKKKGEVSDIKNTCSTTTNKQKALFSPVAFRGTIKLDRMNVLFLYLFIREMHWGERSKW